jgi:TPR repeat protein
MKSNIILALALPLLTGCVSTQFEEYRGHAIYEGKGGGVRNVNGIDIWDIGQPDCEFKIIGYIHQEKHQRGVLSRALASSAEESDMISEAKKHGGDAVVFLSSSSTITGADTFSSGYATSSGSSANYIANSNTRVSTQENRLIAIVKYLKRDALLNPQALPAINEDDRKMFESIEVKAEAGDAQAQWNLGFYYDTGKGVIKNGAEALKWYKKSAKQGNALSQFNVGSKYFEGDDVKRDCNEAFKWFQKAADQGNAYAQMYVGAIYFKGLSDAGTNYVEAVKWMRRSAEQGNADAQGCLGEAYQNGEGTAQDYVEAYKWYSLYAAQGGLGIESRNAIARLMTPEQISEGQRRAAAFVPVKETTQ